jgi:hypothetical protein
MATTSRALGTSGPRDRTVVFPVASFADSVAVAVPGAGDLLLGFATVTGLL